MQLTREGISATLFGMKMFYLFVVDWDRKQFCVLGPMSDDRDLIAKVVAAQETGRDVRCFSGPVDPDMERVIAEYARQNRLQYMSDGALALATIFGPGGSGKV